jgi:SAM-dependent methyltransferase
MSDGYSFLASVYQPLSHAVFGKDLIEANRAFSSLGEGRKSLIIGGGDAFSYREWGRDYSGEYWDTSHKMAELARINLANSQIKVHTGQWPGGGMFDCVFLPFVLDTMHDPGIEKLIDKIGQSLNAGGRVILSDFFPPKTFFQKVIQYLMISGFRIFVGHVRQDMPDYDSLFHSEKWLVEEEKIWRKGWIRARVYTRLDSAN